MNNKYFTKKRVMSLLLSVLMVMGMVPLSVFSAFAEGSQGTLILGDTGTTDDGDTVDGGGTAAPGEADSPVTPPADSYPCAHHTAHDESCGYVMAAEGTEGVSCGYVCPVCPVQALIDALPETVTADNAEDVAAQLTAIDEAKKALTDAQVAMLDSTRYVAAAAALGSVYAPASAADYAATVTVDGVTNNCTYLSTAINAIGAGKTGTITLLRDVEVDETLTIDSGKDITINGGYTISLKSGERVHLFSVSGATLRVENAAIKVDYYSYTQHAVVLSNSAQLYVNSGATLNGGSGGGAAIYVNKGCGTTVNSGAKVGGVSDGGGIISYGNVTINGGTVSGINSNAISNSGTDAVLNMSGGTVTCSHTGGGSPGGYTLSNYGTANITGGRFEQYSTKDAFDMDTPVNISGNVVVQGGSIGGTVNVVGALGTDASIQYTSLADGEVIAVGTDTYTLTESDSAKFISGYPTYTTHVLDTDNNRIVTKRYVASVTPVGGTAAYYTTIDEAVSAVNTSGGTLKMLYNVAVSSPIVITTDCTIDLNGKTISCAGGFSGNYLLQVKEYRRKLTITDTSSAKNGVIDSGSLAVALYVGYETTSTYDNENSVTLQYGTVKGGVKLKESTSFSMTGGTINAANYYGIEVSGSDNFDANVVSIEGGQITASRYAIYCSGTNASITISGGTFSCDKDIWAHDDVVTISGGTFTNGISVTATTLANCLAEGKAYYIGGYMQTIDEDDTGFTGADVTVGDAPNVASVTLADGVTVTNYTTVDEALAEATQSANAGCTVKLLADCKVSDTVTVGTSDSFTLDLNGKTLTRGTNNAVFEVKGKLTVKDSSTGGIISGGSPILKVESGGEFILESGTLTGGVVTSGTFTMTGGAVDGGTSTYGVSVTTETGLFTMKDGTLTGTKGVHVTNGTAIIEGGAITGTDADFDGTVTLKGGTYADGLTVTDSYGNKDTYLKTILADGYSYRVDGVETFGITDTQTGLTGSVTVGAHTHSYDTTTHKCACGAECPHASYTNGVCGVCTYACSHSYGDDNICDICEAVQPAASVTVDGVTENYSSLSDAVAAANAATGTAVTLTLLNNAALDTMLHLTGTYTLDLNGFTVDAGGNLIYIKEGGNVVITDNSDSQAGAVKKEAGIALDISSASLTVEKGSYVGDINVGSDAVLLIKGGSFDGCISQINAKSVVTVEGGSFTNDDFSIFYVNASDGELYITGGTFNAEGKIDRVSDVDIYTSSQVKIVITGGIFVEGIYIYGRVTLADALGDGYAYFADGEEVVSSELPDRELTAANSVTVDKATKIVSVTTSGGETTYYSSIAAAVDFANSNYGCTVKLLQSTATATKLRFTSKCTLDLNGKTLSCSSDFHSDAIIAAVNGGNIIIQGGGAVLGEVDVYEGSTITLKDAKLTGWVYNEGIFNMESGEIVYSRTSGSDIVTTAHDSAIYGHKESTVNITGGKITGKIGVEFYTAYVENLNVSGGTFDCDVDFSMSVGDNVAVTGGEFINGITVYARLNTVLGAGYAYFVNGEEQYDVSDDANTLEGDIVTVELHVHSYTNGFCPCGKYEAPTGCGTADDPYLIANAGQLYWFYEVVSTDDGYDGVAKNAAAHAKLTADIDVNPGASVADGAMTGSATPRSWAPIRLYNGTFDGDGHTVRGLYSRASTPGLFAEINTGGVVKNLGVIHSIFDSHGPAGAIACVNNYGTVSNCFTSDSAVHGADQVGGIVGINYGTVSNCFTSDSAVRGADQVGGIVGCNYGTVEDCLNSSIVMGTGYFVGGIAGYNRGGAISRCGNTGSVIIDSADGNNAGGIAGCNNRTDGGGIITDCYNRGSVTLTSGHNLVGGIAGANSDGDIINCYNTGEVSAYNDKVSDITGDNNGYVENCYYLKTANSVGIGHDNNVSTVTAKEASAFTSGEVTYLLNREIADESVVWRQTIDGTSYPGFSGGIVYSSIADCRGNMGYANTYSDAVPPHSFTDGVCTNKLVDGSTCGYECPHSSVDHATGKCAGCDVTFAAAFTPVGDGPTYYKTYAEAVDAANKSINTASVLKLYKDIAVGGDILTLTGKFTLDGSGKTVSGSNNSDGVVKLSTGANVTLTNVTVRFVGANTRIRSSAVYVAGGTLTVGNGASLYGGIASGIYTNSEDDSTVVRILPGAAVSGARGIVSYGSVVITGGTVTGTNSSGVDLSYGNFDEKIYGSLTISGSPVITGAMSDICATADGNLVYVAGDLGSSVYRVYRYASNGHVFAKPASGYTGELKTDWFTAYNAGDYIIKQDDGNLYIGPCTHPGFTTTASGSKLTHGCDICDFEATVTLTATGGVYNGGAYDAVFAVECTDNTLKAQLEAAVTLEYYKGSTKLDTAPTDAGSYEAHITLGGATAVDEFEITQASLTAADFTFTAPADTAYSGTAKTAVVTAARNGLGIETITLKYYDAEGNLVVDADGTPCAPTAVGTYTAKINVDTADNANYADASDLTDSTWTFTITARDASSAAISVADGEYTGSEVKPTVTVKLGNETLAEGTDYELAYSNNVNTGDAAKVTVTFKGNYSGSAEKTFTITPKALTEDDVSVTLDKDSFTYNSEEQTPTVIVIVDGKTLTESTDYVLGFTADSTNVGGKTVAVAFMGNYSGTVTADYAITAKELTVVSAEALDREYDGTAVVKITDITVKGVIGGDEVSVAVEGMSGTLSAADAGTYDEVTLPKLTLNGAHAGNYALTQPTEAVSTDVTITPCDITGATVKSSGDLTYTGDEQTQIVLSVTTDSGLEVPLTDISITGDKATNVGWYELTITADIDSNFTGQIGVDWAILPENISHLTTDNVTSDDEDLLRDVKESIANAEVNSSEHQKILDDIEDKCDELLDRIEEATDATATENVGATGTVTPDNVTEDDRAALEGAIDDLEDALDKYEGNYTDEEKQLIEDFIEEKQAALDVLDDVKELKDIIENLPDPSTVEPDDIDVLEDYLKAQAIYKQLNDNGKSMLTEAETKKLADTAAALVNYKLTLGDGGTWQKDSGKDLSFTSNGAYAKFVSVKVDGKVVDAANYTVKSGSTVVTLKASYLQGLKTGKHSISVTYPDGSASGSFTVKAAPLPAGTPDTGDNAQPWLWGILAAAAIGAIVAVVVAGKKNKKK